MGGTPHGTSNEFGLVHRPTVYHGVTFHSFLPKSSGLTSLGFGLSGEAVFWITQFLAMYNLEGMSDVLQCPFKTCQRTEQIFTFLGINANQCLPKAPVA